jgi:Bacteriophage holin family
MDIMNMNELVSTTVIVKNSSYLVAFFATVEYLGFNHEALGILGILMVIDIITAIARVWLNEGGQNIRSSVLKRGVTAKLLLITGLFSVAISAQSFGLEMRDFAQGILSVLTLGELYSILGNIHSARTGEPKVEFDAVAWMLGRVKDILAKVIK